MKNHKASSLFPMLEGDEFSALKADIEKNGQQLPAYLLDGKVIDGRNRIKACAELGVEPWVEELDAKETGDPFVFVMSMNYHRRHLSVLDSGRVFKRFAEAMGAKRQPGKRTDRNGTPTSPSLGEVSERLGIPRQTAERHLKTAEDYEALPAPVKAKVDSGDFSVAVAKEVVCKTSPKVIEDSGNHDSPRAKAAQKTLDKRAEEVKQDNAFQQWWRKAVAGSEYWAPWFAVQKMSPARREGFQIEAKRLRKHLKEMGL